MTWLTWRQHRIEVLVMGVMLLGYALLLLVTGIGIAAEAQRVGFTGCTSQTHACLQARYAMQINVNGLAQAPAFYFFCLVLLYILPVLAGIFIGAPALSREFEQGTYRLVWTQGVPWSRWFFKKTGLLICAVTCAFAILFGLFSWWNASFSAALSQAEWANNYFDGRFDTWGVVIVAYAVFAMALGLFFGTLMRKPVAAMAITLVFFIVVRILIVNFWRPYYLPPVIVTSPFNASIPMPAGSWIISEETLNRQGQSLSIEAVADATQACDVLSDQTQHNRCMTDLGFQNRTEYQPPDHFWPFQEIESGIYLLFAVILIAMTYGWMKYRIIGREKTSSFFPS